MSEEEYHGLQASGGISPRGENFVSQDRAYVEQLAARHPDKFERIVRFDMRPGTRDALLNSGARDNSKELVRLGLGHLPRIEKGMKGVIHVKFETGAINFGLRQDVVHIFNSRIIGFR